MILKNQIDISRFPTRTTSTWVEIWHCVSLKRSCRTRYARVQDFFRHRGAYARFKDLLAAAGCLDKWYAFEAECTEQALKDWCEVNQIEVIPTDQRSA